MKHQVTSAPATRPVDWLLAKAHLRLDDAADKAGIELAIDAATDYAQEAMACSLVEQEITATFYAGEPIHLPRGPLLAVASVTDDNDTVITDYDVERVGNSDRLKINVGFTYPLTVVYTAGYETVPASIRQAILMHVATLYNNRETVTDKAKMPVPHTLEDFYRLKSRLTGVA